MRLRMISLLGAVAIAACATPEPHISDRDQVEASRQFAMCAINTFPDLASMTISAEDLATAAFLKCSEQERYYRAVTLAWMKQQTPPELATKEYMLPKLEKWTSGTRRMVKENLAEMLQEFKAQASIPSS